VKDYLDRWYFRRPDGQAVPDCGYCLDDILDDDVNVNDASLLGPRSATNCGNVGNSSLLRSPSAEGFLSNLHKTTDAEQLPTLPQFVAESDSPTYLM
jgi:hypothetical protein